VVVGDPSMFAPFAINEWGGPDRRFESGTTKAIAGESCAFCAHGGSVGRDGGEYAGSAPLLAKPDVCSRVSGVS
jgi:hypothetical protein